MLNHLLNNTNKEIFIYKAKNLSSDKKNIKLIKIKKIIFIFYRIFFFFS